MTDERWQQTYAIYEAAAALAEPERRKYVQTAAPDAEIADRVLTMLAELESTQSGAFLEPEQSSDPGGAPQSSSIPNGTALGRPWHHLRAHVQDVAAHETPVNHEPRSAPLQSGSIAGVDAVLLAECIEPTREALFAVRCEAGFRDQPLQGCIAHRNSTTMPPCVSPSKRPA